MAAPLIEKEMFEVESSADEPRTNSVSVKSNNSLQAHAHIHTEWHMHA